MKKHAMGCLAGAAMLLGGCQASPQAEVPIQTLERPTVATQRPRVEALASVMEIPANVQAWQEAKLYAKVAGYLSTLTVDKGDHVEAGQVIATIESPETAQEVSAAHEGFNASQAAMSQNQAQLARARAQKDETVAAIHAAEAREDEARALVMRVQGERALARQTYDRIKRVYDTDPGLIARQDLDVAEAQKNDAAAKLTAAQEGVSAAHQLVLEAQSKATAADGEILALKALASQGSYQSRASRDMADKAETMMSYTRIRAPFSGIITARYLDPGALVQNSTSNAQQAEHPVVSLANFDTVRVDVQVPQSDLPMVHRRTPVTIVADELPNRILRGYVSRLSGSLDPNALTMLTEIDLPNRDHILHPGQLVRVRLSLSVHPHALTVPLAAINGEGDHRFVYVVAGEKVHKVPVRVGLQTPDKVEITSGLTVSQAVVVSGKENLTDGAEVRTGPGQ